MEIVNLIIENADSVVSANCDIPEGIQDLVEELQRKINALCSEVSTYEMKVNEKHDIALYKAFGEWVQNNHCKAAKQDRDGIFNAYKNNFTAEEFYDIMSNLSRRCTSGDEDIPRDAKKAEYWRRVAEGN